MYVTDNNHVFGPAAIVWGWTGKLRLDAGYAATGEHERRHPCILSAEVYCLHTAENKKRANCVMYDQNKREIQ